MLSRFKIGTRLGVAFAMVALACLGTLIAGIVGINALFTTAHDTLGRDFAITGNAAEVHILALQERRYEKDSFININNPEKVASYISKWETARQTLDDTLSQGMQLAHSEALREHYASAKIALANYAAGFRDVHAQIAAGKITGTAQANSSFAQYKASIYRLEEQSKAISAAATAKVQEADAVIAGSQKQSTIALLTFSGLALLLSLVLAFVITRSIVKPLHHAIAVAQGVANGDLRQTINVSGRDETASLLRTMNEMSQSLSGLVISMRKSAESVQLGAHEVAHGSQDLSSRTHEQSSALHETAASMEQMTAATRQNAEAAAEADTLTHSASQAAEAGGEEVECNVTAMREIAESANKINEIISVIDSIAFQTNILALNASVEAARAGTEGRGFAVVASEVRTLASRSAESAKQIRAMIEATTQQIAHGVIQAEETGQRINETVAAIRQVSNLITEVSTATAEQNSGIEQINVAISQMESVTQQNAALVEQTSVAAASLSEQSQKMTSLVGAFQVHETARAAQANITPVRTSRPAKPPVTDTDEWTAF